MKKLEIITRPEKLEEVKEIISDSAHNGMTVSMVSGCGLQKGRKEVYRGTEITVNLLPKVKIEIVLKEDSADDIIEKIISATRTGNIGDGKIFVTNIEDVYRIRTGERGEKAI